MSNTENFLNNINEYTLEKGIVFDCIKYSYSEIIQLSYNLSRLLESYPTKNIYFNLKNSPLVVCLYLSGFIANIDSIIPINPRLTAHELESILERDSLLITDVDNIVEPYIDEKNIQIQVIPNSMLFLNDIEITDNYTVHDKAIFTHISSGTSGKYKKHKHHSSQIINYAQNEAKQLGLHNNDHLLIALSINHAYAFSYQLLPALSMGLDITIICEFDSKEISILLQKCGITAIALLPTMYYFLAHENIQNHALRYLSVAGDITTNYISQLVKDTFGKPLLVGIGMTEVFGYGQNTLETTNNNKIKIFDTTSIKIDKFDNCDYGNVYITNNMLPTWCNDDWLDTGDIGSYDKQSNELHFYGRYKDIIIKGGSNISPVEIENIILKIGSIKECIVIGKPDKVWGEVVCAFVVSDQKFSIETINHHLQQYLAIYKSVDKILSIQEIPLTSTGKVNRNKLKNIITYDE